MWLEDRRGNFIDWLTQRWEFFTGRRTDLAETPWLNGPVGKTIGIGIVFFDKWAVAEQQPNLTSIESELPL